MGYPLFFVQILSASFFFLCGMRKLNTTQPEPNESFVLVPRAWLESLADKQQRILEHLERKQSQNLTGRHISEEDARKELGKGSTWFWERRKTGELPFVKVGGKVYYNKADLLKLFERASTQNF